MKGLSVMDLALIPLRKAALSKTALTVLPQQLNAACWNHRFPGACSVSLSVSLSFIPPQLSILFLVYIFSHQSGSLNTQFSSRVVLFFPRCFSLKQTQKKQKHTRVYWYTELAKHAHIYMHEKSRAHACMDSWPHRGADTPSVLTTPTETINVVQELAHT